MSQSPRAFNFPLDSPVTAGILPRSMSAPAAPSSRGILVLGMHRSGTSAVTRVLNLLGVQLGARILPPVPGDNDGGFWEHRDAFDVDERLLAGLGRSWHDARELPAGWLESQAASHAEAEIARLVRDEFAGAPLWAVKDPRMCRLAPIWLRALAANGVEPLALFVVRHPAEVAASLRARNGWAPAHSLLLWTLHLLEAERATRACARVMVTYDQVLGDWPECLARISRSLDVVWPRQIGEAKAEIEAYLDAGARHHRAAAAAGDAAAVAVPALVAELFDACLALSRDGGTWGDLAAQADRFWPVAELYGACLEDFGEYAQAVEEHAQRSEMTRALISLRRDVERIDQSVASIERAIARRLRHRLEGAIRRWLHRR